MTMNVGSVAVDLVANTAKFSKGIDGASSKLESFADKSKSLAIGAGAAFAGMSAAIGGLIMATDKQRNAELRLEAAIRGTGQAIDPEKIKAYAGELQKLTTFGDEDTISAAAMLTTFQLTEDQIMSLLPRVQNLSSMYGMDLNQAAITVGKSLTAGAGALSRYGITLSEAEKEAFNFGDTTEKVSILLGALDKNTGNAAEMLATTASGAFKQVANSAGDFAEKLGMELTPALTSIAGVIKSMVDGLNEMDPRYKKLIAYTIGFGTVGAGAAAVLGTMGMMLPAIAGGFVSMASAIKKVSTALWAVKTTLLPIIALVSSLIGALGLVKAVMADIKEKGAGAKMLGISVEEGLSFGNVMKAMGGALKVGVDTILEPLKGAFGDLQGDSVEPASDAIKDDFTKAIKDAQKAAGTFTTSISESKETVDDFDFSDMGEMVADEISDSITQSIATHGPLIDPYAQGTSGKLMDPYSGDYAEMEQQVATSFADVLLNSVTNIGSLIGNSIKNSAPLISKTIEGAMQGFKAGGVFGAIIGAIMSLVSETETFSKAMVQANYSTKLLVKMFDVGLKNLMPMIESFSALANVLILVGMQSNLVNASLAFLGPIFEGVASAIYWIASGIAGVWNWIVDILADFLDSIKLGDAADAIRDNKIKLSDLTAEYEDASDALKNAADDIQTATPEMQDPPMQTAATLAVGSMYDLADSANEVTESLLNMVSGFNVNLARFQSINPNAVAFDKISKDAGVGRGAINIANANILANSPFELAEQLAQQSERRNFSTSGSIYSLLPFSV